MKKLVGLLCWVTLAALPTAPALSIPLGPGFTYQGQLIQNGTPVTGTVHLRFSLWDDPGNGSPPVGGNPIGSNQIVPSVQVANGLFVALLNDNYQFGLSAFNGQARWLQIEICPDASCTAAPVVLAPRQPINATPFSSFSAAPWQLNGNRLHYDSGNVGIGTALPESPLDVIGNVMLGSAVPNNAALTIRGPNSPTDPSSAQDVRFSFASAGSSRLRAYRGGSWDTYLQFLTNSIGQGSDNPQPRMTIDGEGRVGIGTTTPVVALDVMGGIYIGSGPRYSVPGAEEDLKIVRGIVLADGTPTSGCCYWVSHPSTGQYVINFITPFTGTPVVTCNAYAGINPMHIELITPDANSVRIQVRQVNGSLINFGFHFMAIGPRN